MSERDMTIPKNASTKGQSNRVGASVVAAAAFLLSASLGVSAATPPESSAPAAKDPTRSDQSAKGPVRLASVVIKTATPHVNLTAPKVTPGTMGSSKTIHSNILKGGGGGTHPTRKGVDWVQ